MNDASTYTATHSSSARDHRASYQRDPIFDCTFQADAVRSLTAAERSAVLVAMGILERHVRSAGDVLSSPDLVRDWLKLKYGLLGREVFGVLLLDARNRLLGHAQLFKGTLTQTSVHVREVVRIALEHNAASLLCVHQHPSGTAEPSEADKLLTQQMKGALALVDVRLLDHLIVGGDRVVSLAEMGVL